jgi:hypothetical protein
MVAGGRADGIGVGDCVAKGEGIGVEVGSGCVLGEQAVKFVRTMSRAAIRSSA